MIGREKKFDENRIMERIKAPRIMQICPNEEIYLGNNILYILYRSNDLTYPDVGKVTTKFYPNRPIVEHIWGREVLNNLERFMRMNCPEKDKVVKLIEELCELPDVDVNKIEDIFDRYKNILKPACELYKTCYYIPTEMHMLDIRYYNGQPTRINRSCMKFGIIGFVKEKLTKDQALNIWRMILEELDPTDTIEKITCTLVEGHTRNLKADRYHKKGEIKVDSYPKLNIKKKPYGN